MTIPNLSVSKVEVTPMNIQPIVVIAKCQECGNNPPSKLITFCNVNLAACETCITLLTNLLQK